MRTGGRRAVGVLLALLLVAAAAFYLLRSSEDPASYAEKACALEPDTLELLRRSVHPERSGEIILLPSNAFSMPEVQPTPSPLPLVFYAHGVIESQGQIDRETTLADLAPTIATLLRASIDNVDGHVLQEVAQLKRNVLAPPVRLFVTVVWEGVDWASLEATEGRSPNLDKLTSKGVAYGATAGSATTSRAAVSTTIGTGAFPSRHGIVGSQYRGPDGLVDALMSEEPLPTERVDEEILTPTLVDTWAALTEGRARTGLVGSGSRDAGLVGPSIVESSIGMPFSLQDSARRTQTVDRFTERLRFGQDGVPDLITVHYPVPETQSLTREEAAEVVIPVNDRELGRLVSVLNRNVGAARWGLAVVGTPVTRPSAPPAVDVEALLELLDEEYGDVVESPLGHQVFLDEAAMADEGTTPDEIARSIDEWSESYEGGPVFSFVAPTAVVSDASC